MKQKFTRLLTLLAATATALGAYCGPALTITDAQMTKTVTASKLYADSDNIIRGVKFNVTLENTGDAEVVAGKTLTIMTAPTSSISRPGPSPKPSPRARARASSSRANSTFRPSSASRA